jgi:acetyl esterase/lipase
LSAPRSSTVAPKHVVDVLVTLHPGSLTADQFEAVDVPHCLIMADEDMSFDAIRPQVLTILERKKAEGLPVANFVHEGTVHGSFARPFVGDEKIMKAFEEATMETGEWFSEHL